MNDTSPEQDRPLRLIPIGGQHRACASDFRTHSQTLDSDWFTTRATAINDATQDDVESAAVSPAPSATEAVPPWPLTRRTAVTNSYLPRPSLPHWMKWTSSRSRFPNRGRVAFPPICNTRSTRRLAGVSIDDLLSGKRGPTKGTEPQADERYEATVVKRTGTTCFSRFPATTKALPRSSSSRNPPPSETN